MRIIDTHLHLAYRERFSHPWMRAYPSIDRQWTIETYLAQAQALGIEAALHMENDVPDAQMLDEAAFMSTLHPCIVGVIAAARPERADFPAHLEQLQAMSHVRGIRRILHVMPDELSGSQLFVDNIRLLAGAGLSYDICVRSDQLHLAFALASAADGVQFILDHCGNPDIAGGEWATWCSGISRLSALPNVAVKLSGIAVNAKPDWRVDQLRPYVDHLVSAFGWDRLVWGSDHPVVTLNGSLERWVVATHALLATANNEEKAKLLHQNAERIYRLEITA